jgi:hypothetical protein
MPLKRAQFAIVEASAKPFQTDRKTADLSYSPAGLDAWTDRKAQNGAKGVLTTHGGSVRTTTWTSPIAVGKWATPASVLKCRPGDRGCSNEGADGASISAITYSLPSPPRLPRFAARAFGFLNLSQSRERPHVARAETLADGAFEAEPARRASRLAAAAASGRAATRPRHSTQPPRRSGRTAAGARRPPGRLAGSGSPSHDRCG